MNRRDFLKTAGIPAAAKIPVELNPAYNPSFENERAK